MDAARDEWLVRNGFRILRFWNHDILQRTDDVLAAIEAAFAAAGAAPAGSHTDPPNHRSEAVE